MPRKRSAAVRLEEIRAAQADLEKMLQLYDGRLLDIALCQRFAANISLALDVPVENVQQTMLQYKGRTVNPRWARLMAHQLAGRSDELRDRYLEPYDIPVRSEWLHLLITGVGEADWRGELGLEIRAQALTGQPAGYTIPWKVGARWAAFLAYQIGFGKKLVYDYRPEQLVGLRIEAYLQVGEKPGEFAFESWRIDKDVKRMNQLVIKLRKRFELDDPPMCPRDYQHLCDECDDRQCIASYRRFDAVDQSAGPARPATAG